MKDTDYNSYQQMMKDAIGIHRFRLIIIHSSRQQRVF